LTCRTRRTAATIWCIGFTAKGETHVHVARGGEARLDAVLTVPPIGEHVIIRGLPPDDGGAFGDARHESHGFVKADCSIPRARPSLRSMKREAANDPHRGYVLGRVDRGSINQRLQEW
jgi:hypothetical protein